jgi:hypothetical protein
MKYCVICKQDVAQFLPYKNGSADAPPAQKALQCVGSDVDNFACPHCRSTDRERHLFIYLSLPNTLDKIRGGKVLHFAPERYVRMLVEAQQPQEYVMADMFPRDPAVRQINMQDRYGRSICRTSASRTAISTPLSPTTCWNTSATTPRPSAK